MHAESSNKFKPKVILDDCAVSSQIDKNNDYNNDSNDNSNNSNNDGNNNNNNNVFMCAFQVSLRLHVNYKISFNNFTSASLLGLKISLMATKEKEPWVLGPFHFSIILRQILSQDISFTAPGDG